jgi:hypothetical protein
MTRSQAHANCLVVLAQLGTDELRVIAELAKRLEMGQRRYGLLDLLRDARDYLRERNEEVLDASIYAACEIVRADLIAAADTAPAPPPSSDELENGTRVLDVPDAEPTERGQ